MEAGDGLFHDWGDVPVDGDVTPFSRIKGVGSDKDRTNRRHHFVSVTYMQGFADSRGRIQAYLAGSEAPPLDKAPKAIGYENFYYSQTLESGEQDNHRFEDLWGVIETVWPSTVTALRSRRMSPAISFNALGMMALMRVRVPAMRDRLALILESKLRCEHKLLDELGQLTPELQRYAGQFDAVPIGINPQETLVAMNQQFKEFGDLCFKLGFEVLHNPTDTPFLTSDNPVCFYDPRTPLLTRRPYEHAEEIELVFPVTTDMLIRGSSKSRPSNAISKHRAISDARQIRRYNHTIAQFAYRMTLARDRSTERIVRAHTNLVPTISTEVHRNGKEAQIVWRHEFGPPPALSQFINSPDKAARLEKQMNAVAPKADPDEL